ncbi:MAG TPA: M56 family metallopeptidase, partial [Chthoniobacteraceae bacterium]
MNPTSAILQFLELPEVRRLGWVLLHFMWEGAGIGLLAYSSMACMRRAAARYRYLICCLALAACAAVPVATWAALARREAPRPAMHFVSDGSTRPAVSTAPAGMSSVGDGASEPKPPMPASVRASRARDFGNRPSLDRYLPYAVVFWLAGVTLLALRLLLGWLKLVGFRRSGQIVDHSEWLERLSKLAEHMGISSPMRLCHSALVEVPMLIGWLRPVILVPASVFTGLTQAQLEAVLAHELAHIRRHDYLVNVLQSIIETVLFYHPAVWWISARIREERENCCDDIAVETTRDRVLYASALMLLEDTRTCSAPLALAIAQGPLLARIRRIAGIEKQRYSFAPALAGALVVSGVLFRALSISQPIHAADLNVGRLPEENVSRPSVPSADWQVAGIRAAFGDSRQPFVEPSAA